MKDDCMMVISSLTKQMPIKEDVKPNIFNNFSFGELLLLGTIKKYLKVKKIETKVKS
jgi:hypothetical protein